MMTTSVLIIPCYNEETRLLPELVFTLLDLRKVTILFVNDGSTDNTAGLLDRLQAEGLGYVQILTLEKNSGKAEAVRAGFQWALERGARRIGYTDADFATPPGELLRLLDAMESQKLGAVLGCRVARLGAHIERDLKRHITSRIFAVLASICMRVTVYDTQCGAKWFRANSALAAAVSLPFEAKWAFDVELLGRMLGRWGAGPRLDEDDVLEIPIRAWRDVGGSKVSLKGMMRAFVDMLRMAMASHRLGAAHTASLALVPIETTAVHPRESWRPTNGPTVEESSIRERSSGMPEQGVTRVVDYPLSRVLAAASSNERG